MVLREKVAEILESETERAPPTSSASRDGLGRNRRARGLLQAVEGEGRHGQAAQAVGQVLDLLQLTKLEEVFDTFVDGREALVSF
jgi:hypothetical protein